MDPWAACLLVLGAAACGRIAFDDLPGDDARASDGPADARADAPIGPCGIAGSIFCDEFEGSTLVPPWDRTAGSPATNLVIATAPVHAGAGSLGASTPGQETLSYVETSAAQGLVTGDLYVRVWIDFSQVPSLAWLDFVQLEEAAGGIVLQGFADRLTIYSHFTGGPLGSTLGRPLLPRDGYHCVELRLRLDPAAGEVELSIDGALAYQTIGTPTVLLGHRAIRVGIVWAGTAQPASSLFVDDVVIGTEQIGCP
jgi:hypothetical protein